MASQSLNTLPAYRIFIVEDHPIFRMGLADLISQEEDMTVCGSAETPDAALTAIAEEQPDLAIIDLALKSGSGLDLLDRLKLSCHDLPMLVLSTYDEQIYAERCLHAGAQGYINKKEASDLVIKAIRHILKGNIFLSEKMTASVLNKFKGPSVDLNAPPEKRLTNRELEIFSLIGQGLVSGTIAKELHISAKTVYSHTERIKSKLGIRHSPELVRYAALWNDRRSRP